MNLLNMLLHLEHCSVLFTFNPNVFLFLLQHVVCLLSKQVIFLCQRFFKSFFQQIFVCPRYVIRTESSATLCYVDIVTNCRHGHA